MSESQFAGQQQQVKTKTSNNNNNSQFATGVLLRGEDAGAVLAGCSGGREPEPLLDVLPGEEAVSRGGG